MSSVYANKHIIKNTNKSNHTTSQLPYSFCKSKYTANPLFCFSTFSHTHLVKLIQSTFTHQSPTLPAQAGIFQPCLHVFQRWHHQGSDLDDLLPVFHHALTTLETVPPHMLDSFLSLGDQFKLHDLLQFRQHLNVHHGLDNDYKKCTI